MQLFGAVAKFLICFQMIVMTRERMLLHIKTLKVFRSRNKFICMYRRVCTISKFIEFSLQSLFLHNHRFATISQTSINCLIFKSENNLILRIYKLGILQK